MAQTAELFVVDEFVNGRLVAAHRTVRITSEFKRIDFHRKRIKAQQATDQTVAFAQNQLDRLERFDYADETRQDS